jgi:hypothetical protein
MRYDKARTQIIERWVAIRHERMHRSRAAGGANHREADAPPDKIAGEGPRDRKRAGAL